MMGIVQKGKLTGSTNRPEKELSVEIGDLDGVHINDIDVLES